MTDEQLGKRNNSARFLTCRIRQNRFSNHEWIRIGWVSVSRTFFLTTTKRVQVWSDLTDFFNLSFQKKFIFSTSIWPATNVCDRFCQQVFRGCGLRCPEKEQKDQARSENQNAAAPSEPDLVYLLALIVDKTFDSPAFDLLHFPGLLDFENRICLKMILVIIKYRLMCQKET